MTHMGYILNGNELRSSGMIRIKLREIAQKKSISQGKLSRRADVDLRTVQRIYKDPFTNISLYTLDKLAMALDVDASELIETVRES